MVEAQKIALFLPTTIASLIRPYFKKKLNSHSFKTSLIHFSDKAKSTSKVMSPISFMARFLLDYLYLSILNDSIQYSSFVQRISFLVVVLEILLCCVHQIFSFSNRDAEAISFFLKFAITSHTMHYEAKVWHFKDDSHLGYSKKHSWFLTLLELVTFHFSITVLFLVRKN